MRQPPPPPNIYYFHSLKSSHPTLTKITNYLCSILHCFTGYIYFPTTHLESKLDKICEVIFRQKLVNTWTVVARFKRPEKSPWGSHSLQIAQRKNNNAGLRNTCDNIKLISGSEGYITTYSNTEILSLRNSVLLERQERIEVHLYSSELLKF